MRLIDADTLNKELHSLGGAPAEPATWDDGWNNAIDVAIRRLRFTPTIEAEPVRRARWERRSHAIRHGSMTLTGTYPTCTACGHGMVGLDKEMPYCPNCGAKMDGGDTHA